MTQPRQSLIISNLFLLLVVFHSGFTFASVPSAYFDHQVRDFGQVTHDESVRETFLVQNKGTDTLEIKNIELSLPGMKIKVKQLIHAGESAKVKVEWDVSQTSGEVEGNVLLHLNDPKQPKAILTLKGKVISPIDIIPYPAVYLSQFQGGDAQRSVTIQNNQETELKITRLEPKGTHFNAKVEIISPGKTHKINVTTPSDTPPGRYREALIVHTDDPRHQRLHVEMNILVKSDVFVTPEDINFGQIKLAQIKSNPSSLNLLADNILIKRKEGVMTIASVSSDIPFLKFVLEPSSGAAPVFQLGVGLVPEKLKAGTFNGSILLKTDDPRFPELKIPVNATISD